MAKNLLRPVDDQARRQAKTILRTARFGALATIEPETGLPLASRVGLAPDIDGAPTLLISALSAHFASLEANRACSLLVGEPGKGDPLAHPRLTVIGTARPIAESAHAESAKHRYLGRHPKADLYMGFADFGFWRLEVDRALFNAGFGKAYSMTSSDLVTDVPRFVAGEAVQTVDLLNRDHGGALDRLVVRQLNQPAGDWRLGDLDPEGLDLVLNDTVVRIWFDRPLDSWRQVFDLLPD